MTAVVRRLVKWFYISFALAAISLAIVVQAGRSFSHLISEYPAEISLHLSNQFNAKVSIGSISAEWDGLKPALDIHDLRIYSHSNQPIVALSRAYMRLDLLDSFLHLRLVWSSLSLGQVDMTFVQTKEGFWHIAGLPRQADRNPDDEFAQLDPLLDMLLLSRRIEFDQTHLSFQFASGDKTLLSSPSLQIENAANFHRLSLQVDVDNRPKTLSLMIEAKGDPRRKESFSCNAYLELNQFPTNEPVAAVTALLLNGIDAEVHSEGTLSAKLWISSKAKRDGFDLVGNAGVERLSVPIIGRKLTLDSFTTELTGGLLYTGQWQLALQNIAANIDKNRIEKVNFAVTSAGVNEPVNLHMQKLNLQHLNQSLDGAGVWGEARLRDVMRQLNPQGELRNIEISIPTKKPSDWLLRANVLQVASGAWQGVPALKKVDGFLQLGQRGGYVNVDSKQGFSMHYYPTYLNAMEYQQVKGQVAWWLQPELNQIYVNSGAIEFSDGNEKAKGYLWLSLPWKRNSGDIDLYLQIAASQLNASLYQKYTPSVVPQSLLKWLDSSIGSNNTGVATQGGFVYRGTLNTPNHAARSHQLYLDLEQAQLNYHSEWPALNNIKGRLLVSDNNVTASIDSANIFDSDVSHLDIHVRPNTQGKGALLKVDGQLSGQASDGLRALRETMLRQYVGNAMDSWTLQGDMKTKVAIAVPLESGARGASSQIDIDLNSPYFDMANLKLNMRDISGQIHFNDASGLSSENLKGYLFNEPINVALSTKKEAGLGQTLVDVKGDVSAKHLAEWSQRPEVLYLNGKIPYAAHIALNHRATAKDTNTPELVNEVPFAVVKVKSELAGVSISLPEPYGKTAASEKPLIFKMSLFDRSSLIDLSYGDNLQALFDIEAGTNGRLKNATIALGAPAKLHSEPQFLLSGNLPTLDIEPWKKVQQDYLQYAQQLSLNNMLDTTPSALIAGLPFRAEVRLDHYQVGPLQLENIDVKAERLVNAWKLAFINSIVTGDIYLPSDNKKPLQVNLQRLHLTREILEPKTIEKNLAVTSTSPLVDTELRGPSIDPRLLPLANVTLGELFLDENNYGSWSLQIRPNQQGALFDNIHGSVRGITISGADDPLTGAKLHWNFTEQGAKTHFVGALSATNISTVLVQWQKPDTLESNSAHFKTDVSWAGDPQDFSLKKLNGNMDIWLEKGRFKRTPSVSSDGFLRLMAILNFDSLARRLRLDFSDLYQSGLAYDNINGKVNFETGSMTFAEPLVLQTPSSKLQLAGKLDLEHEKINARLVATLPIAGSYTFFTALVTGLPAAAGIYVVSKLFKKQVDQATSISYRITGGWDDPQMRFDRLFESDASLRESVNKKETEIKRKKTKKAKSKSPTILNSPK